MLLQCQNENEQQRCNKTPDVEASECGDTEIPDEINTGNTVHSILNSY